MYLAVKENTALSLHSRLGENRLALLIPAQIGFIIAVVRVCL